MALLTEMQTRRMGLWRTCLNHKTPSKSLRSKAESLVGAPHGVNTQICPFLLPSFLLVSLSEGDGVLS